ncbi:DUF6470 family protein [Bacillus sp. 03113]|uniref:DUF6470 family protein n=1 Tax=Bacillus sp. 03113 TaxID=2578211 RepID=UPI001142F86F|nr:DUF6470 family protein [Bacillus sp. 03113]
MFPQIRLQSSFAQIDIHTQRGSIEIEQPKADLEIEQPRAELNIERTPSKLTIDQTKAREDVGIKSMTRMLEDAAQKGRQDLLEGIARRAEDGDELMKIENGRGAIARIAKRNSERGPYNINIGWIPSAGSVKIDYDPGTIDIQWNPQKPIIHSKINKPIYQFHPSQVQVQLKQYPTLKVDFENLKYVGTNYEQYI